MRIRNTIRNSTWAFICQLIVMVFGFINRIIIIRFLGIEYLGISSLFRDILYLLSIAEMGIGYAIMYEMYKPMHLNDTDSLTKLVNFYNRIYTKIGVIVFFIGLCIIPFLFIIVPDAKSIQYVRIIYIIYILNCSITYLTVSKRSLINVAQKKYIEQIVTGIIVILQFILQFICLLTTHNYLLFTICILVCTLLNAIAIINISKKLFPFLSENKNYFIDIKIKNRINENMKALVIVNISGIILSSTDSIIISNLRGLSELGIFANYTLIIIYLNMIISLGINAAMASIGNLNAEKEPNEVYIYYKRILYLVYIVTSIFCICFYNLSKDFIQVLFGIEYILPNEIVFVLMINMYLLNFRLSTLIFRNAMGLFKYDRYKGIPEIIIKLTISIILVKHYGILGVLLGTTVSTLLVSFWIEPFILYKYGFNIKFVQFLIYNVKCIFVSFIGFILCMGIVYFIKLSNVFNFFIKGIICIPISLIIIICFFFKTDENKYYFELIKKLLLKIKIDYIKK